MLGDQLPDVTRAGAAAGTGSHPWRRLGRSFVTADSYGLVLLLVMVTYIVSVSVTQAWAGSIVLTVQVATVWFTLRTSHARPAVRRVADVVLCLAAATAVVSFFVHQTVSSGAGSSSSAACST